VLELATEELFANSDGFLPTPISVRTAMEEANKRIQTLVKHAKEMPAIYERGRQELEAMPDKEMKREKVALEWKPKQEEKDAADLIKAQEQYQRFNEENMRTFGIPYPLPPDLLNWYREMQRKYR
jgi:hypothetical protein